MNIYIMNTTIGSTYSQTIRRHRLHSKTVSRRRKVDQMAIHLTLTLIILLPYAAVTTAFTLSRRQQSPPPPPPQQQQYYHQSSSCSIYFPFTLATCSNQIDHLDRRNSNRHNMRQEPLLRYARLSNVDELYAVAPKRKIQIKHDTTRTESYIRLDHERRKQITTNSDEIPPPTTTIATTSTVLKPDEVSSKIITKQRTPRTAVNVMSPTTIRRSTTTTTVSDSKSKNNKPRKSRSSTMPGFSSVETVKQRTFRDSVRMLEERTGRKYIDTPEKKQQRRKMNGEAMYKNSPSVPDSLVQFASEIHQEERITRKEEIELGEKTQEAIRLQHLFQSLEDRLGREPTDDEWCAAAGKINMAAIGEAIEDGIIAKNKLVTSNLRMVQSVVNTYIRNGLSAQYNAGDLMQEGIMALIRAAEKFEPDRGWKFSTYAMYWVRASVKRSQMYQSRIIPVPQRLNENHKRLKRIEREMIAATGRRPSMKELGATVGMTEEQVSRCMTAMAQRCYSLDQEIHNTLQPSKGVEGGKDTLIEIVESKSKISAQNYYDQCDSKMLREDLVETLRRYLPPQEAEVLLARYGFITTNRNDDDDDDTTTTNNNNLHNTNVAGSSSNDANTSNNNNYITRTMGEEKLATIAELSRMFNIKPDKLRRMIEQSLKHLNGVGLDEWLAFERELP